mgnify:CR=1 FL=1
MQSAHMLRKRKRGRRLYYMPGTDPVSIAGAKDKIVLMDTQGIGFFTYQDLMKAGAKSDSVPIWK